MNQPSTIERPVSTAATPAAAEATSDQALLATRQRHLIIRASAGSGKTYQLAVRYLRRLLDGVPPRFSPRPSPARRPVRSSSAFLLGWQSLHGTSSCDWSWRPTSEHLSLTGGAVWNCSLR